MKSKDSAFIDLCEEVHACDKCSRMKESSRVLSYASGPINSDIMFIGEAPGRLGADGTKIPFHGDQAGFNFEDLLKSSGIPRDRVFVTNCVLCNPKDSNGNNAPPNKKEITNCSNFLIEQIRIIDPIMVVTLGGKALDALHAIEPHNISLKDVRKMHSWYGRKLTPLYHPGQRAMIHRNYLNQQSDYKNLADQYLELIGKKKKRTSFSPINNENIVSMVTFLLRNYGSISYFKLHKIAYILESRVWGKYGFRLLESYFIRQKDGPYCTDLHIKRLKKSITGIRDEYIKGKLYVAIADQAGLFEDFSFSDDACIDSFIKMQVDKLVRMSDEELKKVSYLTKGMKEIIKKEKLLKKGKYNSPIEFK